MTIKKVESVSNQNIVRPNIK